MLNGFGSCDNRYLHSVASPCKRDVLRILFALKTEAREISQHYEIANFDLGKKKYAPGEARTHNPGIAHNYCHISTVR